MLKHLKNEEIQPGLEKTINMTTVKRLGLYGLLAAAFLSFGTPAIRNLEAQEKQSKIVFTKGFVPQECYSIDSDGSNVKKIESSWTLPKGFVPDEPEVIHITDGDEIHYTREPEVCDKSPDGTTYVISAPFFTDQSFTNDTDGGSDLYLFNTKTKQSTKIFSGGDSVLVGLADGAQLAPSGKYIVFTETHKKMRTRDSQYTSSIRVLDLPTSTPKSLLSTRPLVEVPNNGLSPPALSPDGKSLAYFNYELLQDGTVQCGIYVMNFESVQTKKIFGNQFGNILSGTVWSPTSDKLTLAARDSQKTMSIYTINSDGSGLKKVVSNPIPYSVNGIILRDWTQPNQALTNRP